ncbi:hypothetical protein [Planktothrix sp. PCC 11201]|uniref:hypothetical protein n=1 Tax=Planktothrix sp. PCC 11201 TaxID=1729650 RepID=UPI001F39440F|nr:hypothetical protein [Planktothrix sp. PCC 11201]
MDHEEIVASIKLIVYHKRSVEAIAFKRAGLDRLWVRIKYYCGTRPYSLLKKCDRI